MIRWLSESRSVSLPEEKVCVNYHFTNYSSFSDTRKLISESLTKFGEWGGGGLTVWSCESNAEYKDTLDRIAWDISDVLMEMEKDEKMHPRPRARLAYASLEEQKMAGGPISYKILKPNLLLDNVQMRKDKVSGSLMIHEFSHKLQTDYGYRKPLTEALFNMLNRCHYIDDPDLHSALHYMARYFDDISANEIAIDKGLKDDIFALTQNNLTEDLPKSERPEKPAEFILPVLYCSSLAAPFIHKGEKSCADKLRKITDEFFGGLGIIDSVSLRNDMEGILQDVTNPPEAPKVIRAYERALEKISDAVRNP